MSQEITVNKDALEHLIDERVQAQIDEHRQRYSRRSLLASMAGAAGIGAMGYSWIDEATATDGSAVGQIGTPSDKVNVYAHSLGDPNNPVDEFYVEDEFVTDTQQSLTVDDLTVNQSASIEELSIGALQTETILEVTDASEGSSHTFAFNRDDDAVWSIDVMSFNAINSGGGRLDLTFPGISSYDFMTLDGTGTFNTVSGETAYQLIETAGSGGTDAAAGQFNIRSAASRVLIDGEGTTNRTGHRVLEKSTANVVPNDGNISATLDIVEPGSGSISATFTVQKITQL